MKLQVIDCFYMIENNRLFITDCLLILLFN